MHEIILQFSQVLVVNDTIFTISNKGEWSRIDMGIFGIPSVVPVHKKDAIIAFEKCNPEDKGIIIDINSMNLSAAEMLRLIIRHLEGSSKIVNF